MASEISILDVSIATWLGISVNPENTKPVPAPSPKWTSVKHFTEADKAEALRRVNVRYFAQDLNFRTR